MSGNTVQEEKNSLSEITLTNNVLIDDIWLWIQEVSNLGPSPTHIFQTVKIFRKSLFFLVPTCNMLFVVTAPVSIDPQTQKSQQLLLFP